MFKIDEYRIIVHTAHHPMLDEEDGTGSQRWHDIGEGPFSSQEDAVGFAHAEVGLPWIVVDGAWHPVAYGDVFGLQGDNT
jgi:hypothetical protein